MVIGGVFATQTIDLTNTIVGTFNTPSIKAAQMVSLLLPSAFSIEKILSYPITIVYFVFFFTLVGHFPSDTMGMFYLFWIQRTPHQCGLFELVPCANYSCIGHHISFGRNGKHSRKASNGFGFYAH